MCRACTLILLLPLFIVSNAHSYSNSESFDTEPAYWSGYLNRTNADFGYELSNYAGGDQPGEIGGTFYRHVGSQEYYADKNIGGTYSLRDIFKASGTFSIPFINTPNNGVTIGFFDSNDAESGNGNPASMLGIVFSEKDSTSIKISPIVYSHGLTTWKPRSYSIPASSETYDWRFAYNPNLGNGTLSGVIVARSSGYEWEFSHEIGPQVQNGPATFDSFGLLNSRLPTANPGNSLNIYFDDISYSTNVLFEDDFDNYADSTDNINPVEQWEVDRGSKWRIKEDNTISGNKGLVYSTGYSYSGNKPAIWVGDNTWKDVDVEFDFTWNGDESIIYPFAVTLRDTGASNPRYRAYAYVHNNKFYMYVVRDNHGIVRGEYDVSENCFSWNANYMQDDRCHKDKPTERTAPINAYIINVTPFTPVKFRFQVSGSDLSIYADGVQVGPTVRDYYHYLDTGNSFPVAGRVGLVIGGATSEDTPAMFIDNFVVRKP